MTFQNFTALSGTRLYVLALLLAATVTACSSSTDELISQANAALKSGDVKAALLHAKSAVSQDKNSLKARYVLADSMRLSGDFQGLDEQLRRQLELGGERDYIIPQIALWMLDRNENAKLVSEFTKTKLSIADEQGKLSAIVAMAYIGLRRTKDAEIALQGAGTVNPATQVAAAQLRFNQGRIDEGKLMLVDAERLAVTEGGTKWWVWRNIARMRQSLGDVDQSIQTYKAALKAQPAHFGIKGELGEYYVSLGRLEDAKIILKDLQVSAPNYFRTLTLRAMFALHEGNPNLAYDMASKILAQLPDSDSAAMIVASIDLSRNNLASAERQAQMVVQRNPVSSSAQKLLSMVEAKKGNLKGAASLLEDAVKKSPNDLSLKVELARQMLGLGDRAKAEKLLTNVIAIEPKNVNALVTFAELEVLKGGKNKAPEYLNKALAVTQSDFASLQPLFDLAIKAREFEAGDAIAEKLKIQAPSDPHVFLWKAFVAQEKGQAIQAKEFLSKSLEANASFYPSLSILKAQALITNISSDVLEYEKRLSAAIELRPSDARIYMDMLSFKRSKKVSPSELATLAKAYSEQQIYSVQLRELAAKLLLQDNRRSEADELIKKGVEQLTSTAGMLELATRWAENAGNTPLALERIQALALKHPENMSYQVKRGQLLSASNQNEEALSVLRNAFQNQPDSEMVTRELAFALLKNSKRNDAIDVVTTFGKRTGKQPVSLLVLSDLYYSQKEYSESLQMIEKAIKVEANERTLGAKIRFHDMQNEVTKAEATLLKWLSTDKNKPSALFYATARAFKNENRESTIQYLSQLSALTPDNPYILNDLAFEQASSAKKESLATARKAALLLPTNPKVLDTLALAQLVNDQQDVAEKTLRFAITQNPESVALLVRLVEVLVAKNSLGEANAIVNKLDQNTLTDAFKKRVASLKLG
jgi:putative PEP-CTERM system TPR-repeat lipoprotein